MVQENEDNCRDGADEKMLQNGDQEAEKLTKNNELKVFKSNQNGDAKIEIGDDEKAFTGLTKEQLKQYANDPFWVRMRWFLFIVFWALWLAMLAGAIYIILNAPKCNSPVSRAWHQQGPIVKVDDIEHADTKYKAINDVEAKGVVFALKNTETYAVDKPEVQDKIKKLVDVFGSKDVHVIIDLLADPSVKDEDHSKLNASITSLVKSGIKGIRLRDIDISSEMVAKFSQEVKNATNDEGFVIKPEMALPNNILKLLQEDVGDNTAKNLEAEIKKIHEGAFEHSNTEFEYTRDAFKIINGSEFNMFIMLLPGTPIVPIDTLNYENESIHDIHALQKFRDSSSYQHGDFKIYLDASEKVLGYTWYKIGNPAYIVVFNPTDAEVDANFSHVEKISEEVTVVLKSHAYNIPDVNAKTKLHASAIKMAPRSTLVLTFVPRTVT